MVAYDGSLQSARALYAAAFSVLEADAKVHIVSVATARADAARAADQAIAFLRLHQVDAVAPPDRVGGATGRGAARAGRPPGAGLIVMGAYGEPVLREFFLGSVSRTILKESQRAGLPRPLRRPIGPAQAATVRAGTSRSSSRR